MKLVEINSCHTQYMNNFFLNYLLFVEIIFLFRFTIPPPHIFQMISFDAFECNSTIGYSAKQVYQSTDSIYVACTYVIISAEHMFLIFKCPFNIAQIATVQWAKTYQILEEEEILFCTCVEKNYIVKVNSNITECTNDINKQ